MPDSIRIAVLGNSFAARVQLPALRWAGYNRICALAGRDAAKARATALEWGIPHATGDWRTALETEPDLVLVTSPVHLHHEMTMAALDTGAAVLCEKPFALDAAQASEMVQAARGRPAYLDHQLRFGPPFRRVHELCREGLLGEPWHARFEMLLSPETWRERPYRWWFDANRGGGILGALGSHMLDLLRWFWGEVEAVSADLRTFLRERSDPATGHPRRVTADEFAHLRLRFSNGAHGEILTSCALPTEGTFQLELVGSEAALRIRDGEELSISRSSGPYRPEPLPSPLPPSESFDVPEYGVFGRCLPLFLRELLKAFTEERHPLEHAATFAEGVAVQRILDAARESDEHSGAWVTSR